MPELPEVETVVREIHSLRGNTISSFDLLRPDILRQGIEHVPQTRGAIVHSIERRAKRIIISLARTGTSAPHLYFIIHLGMSGRLTIEAPNAPQLAHTHAIVRFQKRRDELRFRDPRRFGGLWLFNELPTQPVKFLGPLGPDALSITAATLRPVLARSRQVKALLMDQTAIGGLGNIYVDESLHRAGIHPLAIAANLGSEQITRLAKSIRQVLNDALRHNGSTLRDYRRTDGTEGGFQDLHRVYQRTGEPCPVCKTPIKRISAAGRSTHFCPKCQPKRRRTV
jgi:formamidopyrimidine-DNA glycosylase